MILIAKKELQKFIQYASKIKSSNGVLPILDYVKLECIGDRATFTKTNMEMFVICDVQVDKRKDENFSCLIEETLLMSVYNNCNSDLITISIKDGNINMFDGEQDSSHQNQDVRAFISIQIPDNEEKYEISAEEIASFQIAKEHTLGKHIEESWKNLIHIKQIGFKKYLVASDGYVLYSRELKNNIPDISLDPTVASFLAKSPSANFIDGEKYGYFEIGTTLMGFIKSEFKCPDLSPFYGQFDFTDSFLIEKEKLRNYCESSIAASRGGGVESVKIENESDYEVVLNFEDIAGDRKLKRKVKVSEKTFNLTQTALLPRQLLTILKSTHSEVIKLSKQKGRFLITAHDDPEYIGVIQEVQNKVSN